MLKYFRLVMIFLFSLNSFSHYPTAQELIERYDNNDDGKLTNKRHNREVSRLYEGDMRSLFINEGTNCQASNEKLLKNIFFYGLRYMKMPDFRNFRSSVHFTSYIVRPRRFKVALANSKNLDFVLNFIKNGCK